MRTVVVLGGGISGLAAAWRLSRSAKGLNVVLVEGSSRVGGWVQSVRTDRGAVFELGPRSVRVAGPAGKTTLSLVEEVGLAGDVLAVPPSHKGVSRRLIYTEAHGLVELPSSLSWLFLAKPPFSRPLLPAVIAEIFRGKHKSSEDESVYNFISRRLGHEIADWVIDPMCRGIFAASARNLSMRSAFPAIHQYETNSGSIVRGALFTKSEPLPETAGELVKKAVEEKWAIYSLSSGLESLPQAMLTALTDSGVTVHLNQPCTGLKFDGNSSQVLCGDTVVEADHIISAVSSNVLSTLLPKTLSPLSLHLESIPSVTVGVVCLEFKGRVLPPEYEEAFGYLVPSHQPAKILGVVFDSSTFPEHNRSDQPSTRCTVMLGGEWFDRLGDDPGNISTNDIVRISLDAMRDHLGVTDDPSNVVASIHQNCISQYQLGHSNKLDMIDAFIQKHALPLSLVGLSYRGVSVNDCIHNSFTTVDKLLASQQ